MTPSLIIELTYTPSEWLNKAELPVDWAAAHANKGRCEKLQVTGFSLCREHVFVITPFGNVGNSLEPSVNRLEPVLGHHVQHPQCFHFQVVCFVEASFSRQLCKLVTGPGAHCHLVLILCHLQTGACTFPISLLLHPTKHANCKTWQMSWQPIQRQGLALGIVVRLSIHLL